MREPLESNEKTAALARLAAGMSHDFNNLLMVILGNAELGLYTAEPDSPAKPAFEQILSATQRAADYCKQMMAYAGGLRLALAPTDLAALLRDLQPSLAACADDKTTLRLEVPDDLPAIEADPEQLARLIRLLVDNAIDALPPQGGTITLRAATGRFQRRDLAAFMLADDLNEGQYLTLEIADTGEGMDRETAARAFEPFFTTKNKGRGLGTAIVVGIVRGHHGAISIDSQPGQGTRVRVLLAASCSSAMPADPQAGLSAAWRGSGPALVIDPDESSRIVAAALLEHFGFDCLLAGDMSQVLELLDEHAPEVSLILLAKDLPADDAGTAIASLRTLCPAAKLLLVGTGEPGASEPAKSAVADGHVRMPIAARQLGEQLRAAFG